MRDLFIGILAGIATLFIVELTQFVFRKIKSGFIEKVLPLSGNMITIILGGYKGLEPKYKKDLFLHSEVIQAVSKLTSLFITYRIKTKFVIDQDYKGDDNIPVEICVGGEAVNQYTKFYLDKYCNSNYYKGGDEHVGEGTIIKLKIKINPSNEYKIVILLFGEDSKDTESSIAYFSKHFYSLIKNDFKNDNVAIQLQTINEQEAQYLNCITV